MPGSLQAMAGKKVIKKGKKAGGKIVPGDAEEKGSPKVAPKASPKASPKAAPKASPKDTPKASPKVLPKDAKQLKTAPAKDKSDDAAKNQPKPGKPAPRPPPSAEEKQKARAEAIRIIKAALKKDPKVQDKGIAFIPDTWSTKFKPVLGAYRKFVESNECFQVQPTTPSNFIIKVVEGAPEAAKADWVILLRKAYARFEEKNEDASKFLEKAKAISNEPKAEKRKAEETEPGDKSAPKKKAKNKGAKKDKGGEKEG